MSAAVEDQRSNDTGVEIEHDDSVAAIRTAKENGSNLFT